MEKLDRFSSLKSNAERMFPYHEEISHRAYRKAYMRYFIKMKGMDHTTKMRFFNETFYSKDGLCWFMFRDFRYFTLISNSGSINECAYYGKQSRNF